MFKFLPMWLPGFEGWTGCTLFIGELLLPGATAVVVASISWVVAPSCGGKDIVLLMWASRDTVAVMSWELSCGSSLHSTFEVLFPFLFTPDLHLCWRRKKWLGCKEQATCQEYISLTRRLPELGGRTLSIFDRANWWRCWNIPLYILNILPRESNQSLETGLTFCMQHHTVHLCTIMFQPESNVTFASGRIIVADSKLSAALTYCVGFLGALFFLNAPRTYPKFKKKKRGKKKFVQERLGFEKRLCVVWNKATCLMNQFLKRSLAVVMFKVIVQPRWNIYLLFMWCLFGWIITMSVGGIFNAVLRYEKCRGFPPQPFFYMANVISCRKHFEEH